MKCNSLFSFLLVFFIIFSARSFANKPQEVEVEQLKVSESSVKVQDLPVWLMNQLQKIQTKIEFLDATGATKEELQEVKLINHDVQVRLDNVVDNYEKYNNLQNERIEDLHDKAESSFQLLNFILILGTVCAGFLSVNKAKADAREAARDAAREVSESTSQEVTNKWCEEEIPCMINDLESSLREEFKGKIDALNNFVNEVKCEVECSRKEIDVILCTSREKGEAIDNYTKKLMEEGANKRQEISPEVTPNRAFANNKKTAFIQEIMDDKNINRQSAEALMFEACKPPRSFRITRSQLRKGVPNPIDSDLTEVQAELEYVVESPQTEVIEPQKGAKTSRGEEIKPEKVSDTSLDKKDDSKNVVDISQDEDTELEKISDTSQNKETDSENVVNISQAADVIEPEKVIDTPHVEMTKSKKEAETSRDEEIKLKKVSDTSMEGKNDLKDVVDISQADVTESKKAVDTPHVEMTELNKEIETLQGEEIKPKKVLDGSKV